MIRVLIAEDSPTARALLRALFASDPEFEVVAEALDGVEAVELVTRHRPDVVTMDINMPRMGGIEATREIMVSVPTPIVIVSSTLQSDDVAASMGAIRAGALTALARPPGPESPEFEAERAAFLSTLRAMAGVKVVGHRLRTLSRHLTPRPPAPAQLSSPLLQPGTRIVALAASTGGPGALRKVFDALPYDFPAPIVLVQHLASGFLGGFVEWLGTSSRLPIRIASEGARLEAGTVYLAPEDRHLTVTARGSVRIVSMPPVDGFRPSASVLFESVANVYGPTALAAILTGMGRDGVCGLRRIRERGGRIIAQDAQTCSVFGMPGAAIEEGLADFVLPIASIPAKLVELVGQETRS